MAATPPFSPGIDHRLVEMLVLTTFPFFASLYVLLCAVLASRADRITGPRPDEGSIEPATEPQQPAGAPEERDDRPATAPFNWLVPAALATVLGFTPFAVAALVHAARVKTEFRAGDLDAARLSARRARAWFWWSLATGALVVGLMFALPIGATLLVSELAFGH